jgi:hypothetical protein
LFNIKIIVMKGKILSKNKEDEEGGENEEESSP